MKLSIRFSCFWDFDLYFAELKMIQRAKMDASCVRLFLKENSSGEEGDGSTALHVMSIPEKNEQIRGERRGERERGAQSVEQQDTMGAMK
jgi:hypothetical protein